MALINTPEARALHTAVLRADVDAVRYALAGGALADVQNDSGNTPLLEMCFHCSLVGRRQDEQRLIACAELLLAAGANVDAADGDGDTAIAFAAGGDSPTPRVVQLLLDAGANLNVVGRGGWTPLHWAASGSSVETVALLVKHGAAVNAKTTQDWTPLVLAIHKRNYRIYPILLRAGALLPTVTSFQSSDYDYFRRVVAAGGWAKYERLHLDRLTAMLTPRRGPSSPLRRIPPEMIRRIAAYAFHAGYY